MKPSPFVLRLSTALFLLTPVISDAATRSAVAPPVFKQSTTSTNIDPLLIGRSTSLATASAAPAPTNRPLVVNFSAVPSGWFTNEAMRLATARSGTNAGWVWDTNIVVTPRLAFPEFTNYLVTLTIGLNLNTAWTNRSGIITNRGPVTFSVSPTNKHLVTIWGLQADRQLRFLEQTPFPSAPSNVVTFLILLLFADRLETPEALWQPGSNIFSLSVTNPGGASQFMRASVRVVKDDFTPKTVTFGNAYQLFPTNQP